MTRSGAIVAATSLLFVASCSHPPKVTTISIDGRPSAVATGGGLLWVTDDASQTVHVIDPTTNREVGRPIVVKRNPVAIAAHATDVWVAHASGWLAHIDTRTRKVRFLYAGGSLTGVALSPDSTWATDLEHDDLVEVQGAKVVRRIHVADGAVRVLAVRGDLLVSGREHSVTTVDPTSVQPQSRLNVGRGPIGLAADAASLPWVANSDDGTLQRVGETGTVRVGRGPIGVAVAKGRVWAICQDDQTLVPVDLKTLKAGKPIDLGFEPRGVVSDGDSLWVAGVNESGVVRVDL